MKLYLLAKLELPLSELESNYKRENSTVSILKELLKVVSSKAVIRHVYRHVLESFLCLQSSSWPLSVDGL
jgi:hypothetical protein